MKENEITEIVIGAAIEVHKNGSSDFSGEGYNFTQK